jgi:hypothetical protein
VQRYVHTKQAHEAALRVLCACFDSEADPGSEEVNDSIF